jgi:hypothetical protein
MRLASRALRNLLFVRRRGLPGVPLRRAVWLALIGLGAASASLDCSSSSNNPSRDGGGGQGGASGSLYGRIAVQLKEEEGYTDFAATFRDGVFPPPSDKGALVAAMTSGGCQLLVPTTCDPACPETSWCTAKDRCSPKSMVINAGTLAIGGFGSGTISVEPQGNVYVISPTLPFPGCTEGASVTVTASQFTLAGHCVAPLHVTTTAPVRATAGHPIDLAWTAAAKPEQSRVQIAVEISHHGGFKGEIDCDVPDTGSFSIPEPLVTALNGLGRAGYPTIALTRAATFTAASQPNVSLAVSSEVVLAAETGVVSCAGNGDCTAPATCQPNRTCQ